MILSQNFKNIFFSKHPLKQGVDIPKETVDPLKGSSPQMFP
jgi:hypothetical protein